jgi:hypothetical protein
MSRTRKIKLLLRPTPADTEWLANHVFYWHRTQGSLRAESNIPTDNPAESTPDAAELATAS